MANHVTDASRKKLLQRSAEVVDGREIPPGCGNVRMGYFPWTRHLHRPYNEWVSARHLRALNSISVSFMQHMELLFYLSYAELALYGTKSQDRCVLTDDFSKFLAEF